MFGWVGLCLIILLLWIMKSSLRLLFSSQSLYRISREDWNVRKTHIFDVQTVPDIEPIFLLESILKVFLFVEMHSTPTFHNPYHKSIIKHIIIYSLVGKIKLFFKICQHLACFSLFLPYFDGILSCFRAIISDRLSNYFTPYHFDNKTR